ncbi:MAG: D-alanine--D-alanine ligase [Bacteroidetes bacterium]|nr:MAG: D-alanine--D-alanine ligase [Bacteroidota bacterium]
MHKPNIAFVTGGYSREAEISYKSAVTIAANIDAAKYNAYTIDIRTDGWWHTTTTGETIAVDKNDFSLTINGEHIGFDAVLIGIHGTPGEDGKLQGYFDMLNLPYSSCNAAVSALTFNKRFAVAMAAASGIHVAKGLHFYKHHAIDVPEVASQLQFPVFVKPANGGSSIGMSKVPDATGLQAALTLAFSEDDQVLVEECIEGREFTVGVARLNGKITVLPITEVESENYFFDFEAKYQGKNKETTPANLEQDKAEKVRETAVKIYEAFNCKGVIRIDFIYNAAKDAPFMLEINTIPGQSAASVVPQQVQAMGMSLKDFYSQLIDACL